MVAKATFRLEGENATGAAFAQALRGAQDTAHRMQGIFRAAFAGLSIAGIAAAVKQTLDFGDQLNKARIRAGMSAEAFTQLAYAARAAGVETSAFSTALRTMQTVQVQAITGGKEQKLAFDALGISLEQFRRLQPDKQFELLADRISQLEDPAERARAAMVLFGRSGAELLPLMEQGAEGIRKAREEAEKIGQSFSAEQLERLEKANDAVSRLRESFSALAVTLIAKVAPGLSTFFDHVNAIVSGDRIGKLREQIDFLERMQGRSFLAFGYGDIGTGFFSAEEGAKKLEELRRKLRLLERPVTHNRGASFSGAPGFAAIDAAEKKRSGGERDFQDFLQSLRPAFERIEHEDFLRQITEETREWIRETEDMSDELNEYVDMQMRDLTEKIGEHSDEWSVFADQAARNMQSAFADFLFDPFDDGLRGMLKGFVDTLRRMVAEAAAARIFDALFGKREDGGGAGGFLGGLLGGLFGGGRSGSAGFVEGEWDWLRKGGPLLNWRLPGFQHGGSFVVPGSGSTDSMVPLFRATPGERVTITPRGQSVAPIVNITTNVDARGATVDAIRALPEVLRRNNAELEARIVDRIRRGFYDLSPA